MAWLERRAPSAPARTLLMVASKNPRALLDVAWRGCLRVAAGSSREDLLRQTIGRMNGVSAAAVDARPAIPALALPKLEERRREGGPAPARSERGCRYLNL
jgi:hypothetical protein